MKKLVLILGLLPAVSMANCITVSDTGAGTWTGGIELTNNCGKSLDMSKMTVSFPFSSPITTAWGSPYANWSIKSANSTETLTGQTGTLSAGESATILFSITPQTVLPTPSSVIVTTPDAPNYGKLNVTVSGLAGQPVTITAKGPYNTYQKTVSNNGTVVIGDNGQVATGNYTISASSYTDGKDYYLADITNKSVTVNTDKTSSDTANYAKAENGTVNVTNTQNIASNITFTDKTNGVVITKKNVNGSIAIPVGNYTVSASRVSDNAVEGVTPSVVTVSHDATAQVKTVKPSYKFAPYIDFTNSYWDGKEMAPSVDLNAVANTSHVKNFTLAFITDSGDCNPAWAGTATMGATGEKAWGLSQVKQFQQNGGNVIISFGGENGTMLASSCNQAQLTKIYNAVIDTYHPVGIDFDIEGGNINKTNDNKADYIGALKAVKKAHPDMLISFTIPVLPNGLKSNPAIESLLKYAANTGLDYSRLNLMTMDFGAYSAPNPNAMGTYTIKSGKSVFKFLKSVYGNQKTTAQLWNMIGLTPMIGMNDVTPEVFTLANAKQVARFAASNNVGAIRFWSINRDNPCASPWADPTCSGGIPASKGDKKGTPVQKHKLQFAEIFEKPLD